MFHNFIRESQLATYMDIRCFSPTLVRQLTLISIPNLTLQPRKEAFISDPCFMFSCPCCLIPSPRQCFPICRAPTVWLCCECIPARRSFGIFPVRVAISISDLQVNFMEINSTYYTIYTFIYLVVLLQLSPSSLTALLCPAHPPLPVNPHRF